MARVASEGLPGKRVLAVPVVVAVALIGVLLLWTMLSNSPDEVSLDHAVSQVQDRTDETSAYNGGSDSASSADTASDDADSRGGINDGDATATAADGVSSGSCASAGSPGSHGAAPANIAGVWSVDTSVVVYDYGQGLGSFAGFRVDEELTSGKSTAVGRTGEVTSTLTLTEDELTSAEVIVDMSAISTDRSIRDGKVHSTLKTDEFPEAVFRLAEPVCLSGGAAARKELSMQVVGDLTIAGVTKKAVFNLQAHLTDNNVIAVVGWSRITFTDYDIQTPSAPILVSVDDHGVIELQLFFTRTLR